MSATAAVSIVTTTAKTLDVLLPDEFTAAVDRANALIVAAENLSAGPQQLHAAVLDAVENDRDLHTDKAATRELRNLQLGTAGVGQAARQRAEHDIAAALVEHADTMLGSWCDPLQPHLDALSVAATELPENLDDTTTISSRGAAAMRHWAAA